MVAQTPEKRIDSLDPALKDALPKVQLVRDFIEADQTRIREKRDYLVKAHPDQSERDYQYYRSLATPPDILERTWEEMTGRVFRTPPVVESSLPEAMLENIDGKGLMLDALARQTFEQVLRDGRVGVLVVAVNWQWGLRLVPTESITQGDDSYCIVKDMTTRPSSIKGAHGIINPVRMERYTLYHCDEGGPCTMTVYIKTKGSATGELRQMGEPELLPQFDRLPLVSITPGGVSWDPGRIPLYALGGLVKRYYRAETCIEYALARRIPPINAIRGAAAPAERGQSSSSRAYDIGQVVELSAEGDVIMSENTGDIVGQQLEVSDRLYDQLAAAGASTGDAKGVEAPEAKKLRVSAQVNKLQPVIKGTSEGLVEVIDLLQRVGSYGSMPPVVDIGQNLVEAEITPEQIAAYLDIFRESGDVQLLVDQLDEGEVLPKGFDKEQLVRIFEQTQGRKQQGVIPDGRGTEETD